MTLDLLQSAIELHLEEIEKLVGKNYKLTLIANHNGADGLKDADIVLTMSDRDSIVKAIDRFFPAPAARKSES